MSIYDQRESPAYRNDFRIYRNRNFDKWWSAAHDQLIVQLIEKYQWNWYWEISDSIESVTPRDVMDSLSQQSVWYNKVMYYAITRAEDLGLAKTIRASERKKCPLCGEFFQEESLPHPLVKRLGIEHLDFCSPCLKDRILSGTGNNTATKTDISDYLNQLTVVLERVPSQGVDTRLKTLKQVAQNPAPYEQAKAQYPVGEHIFEVKDKGSGLFPYVLQDNAFRIALSRYLSKSLPMAYVQISSHFLTSVNPEAAEKHLRKLLDQLGDVHSSANVSRVDLFVDFISDVDMESWDRLAWVTRAHTVNSYSVKGKFSGWAIGLGGVIACRLYDKTLELEESGKDYLKGLWAKAGWQEGQKVWRLEFELKRECLTQKGVSSFGEVMRNLSGLWSYATDEWLRLTLPEEKDKTRSRWAIHPLWQYLASIDWEGDGGPLLSRFKPTRAPDDKYLFGRGVGLLTAFMAREGYGDFYEAGEKYLSWLSSYADEYICMKEGVSFGKYVEEQVAIKARRFNTALNVTEEKWDNIADEAASRAYWKASKGG